MHESGTRVGPYFDAIQEQPIQWCDFVITSWLAIVVGEYSDSDVALVLGIQQSWEHWEFFLLLVRN